MKVSHIELAEYFFRTKDLEIYQTDFGTIVLRGNRRLPRGTSLAVGKVILEPYDGYIHERIAFIERGTGIRSHQETDREIVRNIGDVPLLYLLGTNDGEIKTCTILPGQTGYTVYNSFGHNHGFALAGPRSREKPSPAIIYVAKSLNPGFPEGNSFRMPENTYRGPQPGFRI